MRSASSPPVILPPPHCHPERQRYPSRTCHPERSEGSRPSARRAPLIHGAVCSHASRRAAAGRYFLRLSMCARRFAPNAHASLRNISPCVAARRCMQSRLPTRRGRSVFPPSHYAGVRVLHALPPQFATGDTSLRRCSALFSPPQTRSLSALVEVVATRRLYRLL